MWNLFFAIFEISVIMKELVNRIRFFIDKIKYRRSRHFYITLSIMLCLVALTFAVIYIDMHVEIKRKENILKSYYENINSGSTGADKINGSYGAEDVPGTASDDGYNNLSGGAIGNNSNSYNENFSDSQTGGDDAKGNTIKAYICGNVENPGVYEFEEGARIIDLLELAGGEDENACVEAVNLAQFITDGQRIYIPSEDEACTGDYLFSIDSSLTGYNTSGNKIVNINTAGVSELDSLPGIGPAIALNIVKYRNEKGLFKAKEELKNVTGIGDKKYDEIKESISI